MSWRRLVPAALAMLAFAPAADAAKPRADLSVSKAAVGGRALAQGAAATVTWTVRNGGRAPAAKSTTEVVLSVDGKLDRADIRLGSSAQKAVKARKTATGKLSARVPAATAARRYTLLVCADARNKVRESSERNNCRAAGAVDVTAAPAPAPPPAPPAPPAPFPAPPADTPTPTATAPPEPAPETTITAAPADVTGQTTASFSFAASIPGSTFQCRLDGDAFAPCASPTALHDVLAGERAFEVRAVSPAGIADPTPARHAWRIEFEAPAPGPALPAAPAPESQATTPDVGQMTLVSDTTRFLYTGADAIQKGVADGAIEPERAAVLRGKVIRRNGTPVEGVRVRVLENANLGHTATRTDGGFELAVNGGEHVTVAFERAGYIPTQRRLPVPTQDYETVEDVVMVPYEDHVSGVDLADGDLQVARGSAITDGDGTRRATLLLEPATEATATLANGTELDLGDRLNIRATEFTIGDTGPAAMPGELPPASAYTYAVEYSVDEATAQGAVNVEFSKPVVTYVDNMLGFPTGTAVPMGYYDRELGQWVASRNGVVIAITGESGGLATVQGATLDSDERRKLAELYDPGKSLWRAEITHFTPWDYNWPYGLPDGAGGPGGDGPEDGDPDGDDPCNQSGSIILCESQVLGERSPIAGTPYSLTYQSDRVPGRRTGDALEIPLTPATPPANVARVDLTIEAAGKKETHSFPPTRRSYTYVFDGKDAYGRLVQGRQKVDVTVDYVYPAVYRSPDTFQSSFAAVGGAILSTNSTRSLISVGRRWRSVVGDGVQSPPSALAGWNVDVHHTYDPIGRTLYMGDGSKRSAEGQNFDVISTARADLQAPEGLVVTPDGARIVADSGAHVIRRIASDGTSTVLAGTEGVAGFAGDGGPADQSELDHPSDVALARDGSIVVADRANHRVRLIKDGRIRTVAGGDESGDTGDGGPAAAALLDDPTDVAADPDGAVYVVDRGNQKVRRIGADGTIATLAGTGAPGFGGDGGIATKARLRNPRDVVVAADGGVFVADGGNHRVRRIDPDGTIATVAGDGHAGFGAEGAPATQTSLDTPSAIAPLPDGSLLVADSGNARVRKVGLDGRILSVAGTGTAGTRGDGGAATRAQLDFTEAIAIGADDTIHLLDGARDRIRAIDPTLPGLELAEQSIASEDGRSLYVFDPSGRHLRTVDTLTKATVLSFGYDSDGRLTSITDGDNRRTTIERVGGVPTAIVGPDDHVTTLGVTGGYLTSIVNPAGDTILASYDAGGLLRELTDPNLGVHEFDYDAAGRLISDTAPDDSVQTLVREAAGGVTTVTHTSGEGRKTTYRTERGADGSLKRTVTDGEGAKTVTTVGADGITTVVRPDGTRITDEPGPDPRFGMQSPLSARLTIASPEGRRTIVERTRSVDLATPGSPMTLRALTERTIVNGRVQLSHFDAATRTFTDTSPAGRSTVTVVDGQSRPLRFSTPGVTPTVTTYEDGRVKRTTQGERSETFDYDERGRVKTITDGLDRETTFTYDDADRPRTQTLPGGRVVTFDHDRNGNLKSLTPPGRPKHEFTYWSSGVMKTATAPGAAPTTYTPDKDGLVTGVDRPGTAEDITLGYDDAGRLETNVQSGRTTTLGYDAGRLATAVAGGERVTYDYDGTLVTRTTVSGAAPGVIDTDYDDDLRLQTETVGGVAVDYDYDDDDLPVAIGPLTLDHDDENGLLDSLSAGASTTTVERTPEGEPETVATTQDAATTYAQTFTHDDLGRITGRTETRNGTTVAWEYGFDEGDRLETVKRDGTVVASYDYDLNGNRVSASTEYNDRDQLLRDGATTYTYTDAGALRTRTTGAQTTTYDYDANGALTGVTLPGGAKLGYVVDAGGRRVAETGGASQRRFLYGRGLGPVAELNPNGSIKSRFIYATRSNVPDLMIRDGATYRIVTDHVGSPVQVVDVATGAVVQERTYDAFGAVLTETGDPEFQPFGFAGGLWDRETGLVRFGARDYDPETGRFTAPDPLGFAGGGTNLYGYALADPVNLTDPTGQILDTIIDLGFIAYDLYKIGKSLMDGCGVSGIDAAALGLDVAAMFIPGVTGAGQAARRVNEGIYEVITKDGRPYVGQSSDIDRRLGQHVRDGKITQEAADAARRSEVTGGKTQREIAEQRRINELTDGVGASHPGIANQRNPIGPKRQHLLD